VSEAREDAARWERIQQLFHEAADRPAAERRALLEAACAGDAEMLADVLGMLEEDVRAGSLLDGDVAELAGELVGAAPADPLVQARFGPYRVERLLGEGGMGVVYLGAREDLGTRVAIKVLPDAWLSPSRRERFASEQRTLAHLEHPSIARLYDADTLPDGTPWFVMEYVEGAPITEHCARREAPIRERLRLFREVCEAVRFAHAHAVIHRDLKPSNILVKDDGSIRLLDFGIAKPLESLDRPADRTHTGLRLMTPAYASPEQVRGERLGVHTDVYSLGVILYELLAGRLPFDLSRSTPAQAEAIVTERDPEKPSAVAARAPVVGVAASRTAWAELDVLCLTAMHKDPERRYRSVEALIRDVDHYLRGEPLEARPESVRYRVGKFVRRHRRALGAAAIVLAAVVGLVAFFTVRLAIARNQAVAQAERTERIQQFTLDLFQGGQEAGPAEDLRVVSLLDRGLREARALDREPETQASLYLTLGGIYQKLGRFEQADTLLKSALEKRRALFGAEHPQVAESLVALGSLRYDQAKLDEAESLVREGLAMDQKLLPRGIPPSRRRPPRSERSSRAAGTTTGAIKVLDDAVRMQSAGGEPSADLAASLTELANATSTRGTTTASEALNQRVIEMDRAIHGARHPNVADDLINLGAIKFERGRYKEAESDYRAALDIIRAWYGEDHQETASAETMIARALLAQKRNDEALVLLRQALAVQERVYGKVHPRVASALNELGLASMNQERTTRPRPTSRARARSTGPSTARSTTWSGSRAPTAPASSSRASSSPRPRGSSATSSRCSTSPSPPRT
jgi:serine/threonine-protein kinase